MRLPPKLFDVFKDGGVVLVTGLHCGTVAGRTGWHGLLERLTGDLADDDARAVRALLARENWGLALATLRERLGPELLAQLVSSIEGEPAGPVRSLLAALCQVPFRAMVTTALADTWECALTEVVGRPTVLSAGAPLDGDEGTGPVLIHALGRASLPETLCLSPLDLRDKVAATGLEELLCDLARNFTLVFVGFGAGDPDLEWLAGRVLGRVLGEQPHFILNLEGPTTSAALRSAFGLEPLSTEGPLADAILRFTTETLIAGGHSIPDVERLLEGARADLLAAVLPPARGEGAVPEAEWGPSEAPPSTAAALETPIAPLPDAPRAAPAPPVMDRDPHWLAEQQVAEAGPVGAELSLQIIAELERQTIERQWGEAAALLERLVALEKDPRARARYLHAQALVHRRAGGDSRATQAFLQLALDEDADLEVAWDGLERLHRESGDGAGLRRCQVRRLRRVRTTDRAQSVRLFDSLAESAGQDLGDRATAEAALEAARALDPDHREERDVALARLYLEAGPDATDKAIAAYQSLIARNPDSAAPYRVLARLWKQRGAASMSGFALAALSHLEAPDDPRPARGSAAEVPTARLTDSVLRDIAHPDDDPLLGQAFALVGPALAGLCARPREAFRGETGPPLELSTQRPDPNRTDVPAADRERSPALALLQQAARVMDVPAPELHLTDSGFQPLTVESVGDGGRFLAALVMRRAFARGAPAAELLFAFAHVAALLRAPTLVRFALPSPGLLALGLTVVEGLGKLRVASADRTVRTAVSRLRRRLGRAELARLKELATALTIRSEPPDLRRWIAASDLTAARAALVVTGDLTAALAVIGRQDTTRGALPAEERVKDLLSFAVSSRHFAARRALGLEGTASDGVAIAIIG